MVRVFKTTAIFALLVFITYQQWVILEERAQARLEHSALLEAVRKSHVTITVEEGAGVKVENPCTVINWIDDVGTLINRCMNLSPREIELLDDVLKDYNVTWGDVIEGEQGEYFNEIDEEGEVTKVYLKDLLEEL